MKTAQLLKKIGPPHSSYDKVEELILNTHRREVLRAFRAATPTLGYVLFLSGRAKGHEFWYGIVHPFSLLGFSCSLFPACEYHSQTGERCWLLGELRHPCLPWGWDSISQTLPAQGVTAHQQGKEARANIKKAQAAPLLPSILTFFFFLMGVLFATFLLVFISLFLWIVPLVYAVTFLKVAFISSPAVKTIFFF